MSVLLPFVLGAVLGDYIPRTTHSKMTKILKILFVCVCVCEEEQFEYRKPQYICLK